MMHHPEPAADLTAASARPADRTEVRLTVGRRDLLEAWSRCGATANYLAAFLVRDPGVQVLGSTVFNEIVENAAKYAAPGDTVIELRAWAAEGELGIEAHHLADHGQVERLTGWIERLGSEEVDLLIERTAATAGHGSRLGLLTLVREYGARLSVRVAPFVGPAPRRIAVRLVLPCAVGDLPPPAVAP